MDVSCHRPFLPGTTLEPVVISTAQASSFTLQYFAHCVCVFFNTNFFIDAACSITLRNTTC